jgi:hypothetical protein
MKKKFNPDSIKEKINNKLKESFLDDDNNVKKSQDFNDNTQLPDPNTPVSADPSTATAPNAEPMADPSVDPSEDPNLANPNAPVTETDPENPATVDPASTPDATESGDSTDQTAISDALVSIANAIANLQNDVSDIKKNAAPSETPTEENPTEETPDKGTTGTESAPSSEETSTEVTPAEGSTPSEESAPEGSTPKEESAPVEGTPAEGSTPAGSAPAEGSKPEEKTAESEPEKDKSKQECLDFYKGEGQLLNEKTDSIVSKIYNNRLWELDKMFESLIKKKLRDKIDAKKADIKKCLKK